MKTQPEEDNFEIFQDRLPLPAIQVDAETGAILSCNKALASLINQSQAQVKGKAIEHWIEKKFLNAYREYIAPKSGLDQGITITLHLDCPQQKNPAVSLSGYRFKKNEKNCIQLFLNPHESHSEKAQLQNEAIKWVSQSEVILKQAFEVAKMGHWELDFSTNRLFWSDEVFALLGCNTPDFDNTLEGFLKFIHPEDRQKVERAYTNHLKQNSNYNIIHRIITSTGQVKHVRERCKTSFDEYGKPVRSFGIVADITDMILSELELEDKIQLLENQKEEISELHRLMELTLEQAVDAVVTINDKKEIIFVNQSMVNLLGYSKEELMGRNVNIILPMSDREAHDKAIETNLHTGINRVAGSGREFQILRKDGSLVWAHLSLSKVEFMGRFQFTAFLKDISARKNAEQKMLEAQNRFEEIGIHTRTMAWQINLNGLYTYVSKSSKELLGYLPEELEGKFHYYDLHPKEGRDEFMLLARELLAKNKSFRNLPNLVQTKSGEILWVSTNGFPIQDDEGNLIGYQGSDTDITQEVKHEEEIHLLKQAIDSSSVSITLATAEKSDFPLIYVNDAFCEVTGYSKEEVLNKNCRFLQGDDKNQEGLEVLRKALKNAEPVSVIIRNYTKTGKLFYNQLSVSPIFNKNKKLSHFLGVQRDVTQLKQVELALLESEANLKALLNSSSESVWSIDKNYRIAYANGVFSKEFRDAFGHYLIPGDQIISLLPKSLQQKWKDRYDKVLEGESIQFTERIPTPTQVYYVNVLMNPIVLDNQVTGVSVFSKNVSAEEEAKQALRNSEERFKSLFTGNITPMLLIDPTNGNISDINPSAEKFYGYKQTEAIGKHLRLINTSITDFDAFFDELRKKKGIRFEFKHWKADQSLIDVEVFCSLILINGKEVIHETVHDITERNQYFNALETQNKIFRDIAWVQSHLVRAPLARLMGLMELLRDSGQDAYSQEEILNLMTASANELDNLIKDIAEKSFVANKLSNTPSVSGTKESSPEGPKPLHVLLIDDDKMVQLLQKAMLKKHGFTNEPEVFMQAEAAIAFLKNRANLNENFLIFLDINMPGLNGWQFLDELENFNFKADIRVIMLSSSVDLEDKVKSRNYTRVIDYQTKPLTAELLHSIRNNPKLSDFF